VEYLYLGIVGCVCREGCMSGYMVGVEYIDEGLAVGAFCEGEMSEHRGGFGVSVFGDCGLCM
jgi:hypothetical protein